MVRFLLHSLSTNPSTAHCIHVIQCLISFQQLYFFLNPKSFKAWNSQDHPVTVQKSISPFSTFTLSYPPSHLCVAYSLSKLILEVLESHLIPCIATLTLLSMSHCLPYFLSLLVVCVYICKCIIRFTNVQYDKLITIQSIPCPSWITPLSLASSRVLWAPVWMSTPSRALLRGLSE